MHEQLDAAGCLGATQALIDRAAARTDDFARGDQAAVVALHVRAACRNGRGRDEIGEVMLQCAISCGVPAANAVFAVAQRVLEEEDEAWRPRL